MINKQQAGFLIIIFAAVFSTLAFVIWPTIYASNKEVTASEATNPETVVQEFYNGYLHYNGNPLVDKVYRSNKRLSPSFVASLDDFTQGEMHFDPVLCAQDKPVGITTHSAQMSGDRAVVGVTDSFPGHRFSVELVQIDGEWKIDRVVCNP
jgi:hypothetical protein